MFSATVQLGIGLAFAVVAMSCVWLVQRRTRNAGIVDVAWAGLTGALGVWFVVTSDGDFVRRVVVGAMIGLWSARLTGYLFVRVAGHPEEGRYRTLREKWGEAANRRLFAFFQMQALAALFFALPVLVVAHSDQPLRNVWDLIGLLLWSAGVIGVTLADWQLARFKRDPAQRDKTCQIGLWRYSRHPNYFFEWVHWCAYVPLAFGSTWWWVALLTPLGLLYFLFFVTGIPPTEAQALASRGDEYRRYQRTTSVFIPWFRKADSGS